MLFNLICEKLTDGECAPEVAEKKEFTFDNLANRLWVEEGKFIGLDAGKVNLLDGILDPDAPIEVLRAKWSKDNPPGKSRNVKRLKVQMGLSCNFECSYCSQRFIDRPVQGNPEKVDELIAKVQAAFDMPKYGTGLRIEFWGGEPFVYWKTFKPLAEKLRALYPAAQFSVITNGSLLTRDIVDWLDAFGFSMSVSHDGPGQHVRGPCPIDDGSEVTKDAIRYASELLGRQRRFSFGSMLNKQNTSRQAIRDWFDARFSPGIPIGEGGLIDAYDEDGFALSLSTKVEHFEFRRTALMELLHGKNHLEFSGVQQRVQGFMNKLVSNTPLTNEVGQKCGMESETSVAIDMDGNVLTCQNTSAIHVAGNGESHGCGNIADLASVKLKSSTHWADRPHCQTCPVVSICNGACMFIEGKNWFKSCDNSYTDNIVIFALVVLQMTGYLPTFIDSPGLPDHRRDIWGSILEHKDELAKKAFPISVVSA